MPVNEAGAKAVLVSYLLDEVLELEQFPHLGIK